MAATPTRLRHQQRERIDLRISDDLKSLLQYAAGLRGSSLTEFVVRSAQEKAEETIRQYESMVLSRQDSASFVEALLNPPAPNERLRAAAQRYREFLGE